jgi:hypothetical protein
MLAAFRLLHDVKVDRALLRCKHLFFAIYDSKLQKGK